MYRVMTPETDEQIERYYYLRWRVLREPFQRPLGSEQDEYDQVGHHRMVVNEAEEAVAVGRLHFNSPEEAQIRFMAVAPEYRGEGHGVAIIYALELAARKEGATHVVINSRDNTIGFYKKCGYEVAEEADTVNNPMAEHHLRKSFTEYNRIIYRPEWCAELQKTWQEDIPISDAMGIKIHQYTGRVFETRAVLSRNINVHGTMFAGSIYSLGTLTCWGLLHLQLLERELEGAVVLGDGNIHYHKPVTQEPRAIARLSDVTGDFSALKQGKNARLTIKAQILDEEQPVAEFTGRFVVLAKRD
ncbi:bifunctional GNAT family N-acetyltransferase/hotdog fold thioesterase [Idiomarina sp. PL1-037]|uniref:bifunctional GNAT family N-acetyltransferase/hotdog fold thioesterase n=1 Tax=Idiomarina TaxID=135575 RepID=UPI00294B4F32|nr:MULTISPECIES: bifunctional GNAT family N-acetyltransferase/hotdog fold thioesterase [unclassified Idiomarina]MDV6327752.1 bifunctional GNAT family N-acetyltransferase/hotdog fold thioesterase [Idiomarina sp. Sol25]WQC52867.1 bifunctional GNAT family N-acetyltransferase/hotdog fold thioesterase [Idiomarina sp. PL1-037]